MRASQSKRSPLVYLFLVLALLVFVGFYMMPLLGGIEQGNTSANDTNPFQTISVERQQELNLEARGYQLTLQREPSNNNALRGLLNVTLEQGDLQGATEPLERLANLHPEETGYTVLLAQLKQRIEDYDGAIAAYYSILNSQPGNLEALQGMTGLLLQQGNPAKAIEQLQSTIKIAPEVNANTPGSIDETAVKLLLGQVYVSQEREQAAIAVYDQAIDAAQQDWRPWLAKAVVLQQQGRTSEAKPLFNSAISLAPEKYQQEIQQMIVEATSTVESEQNPN